MNVKEILDFNYHAKRVFDNWKSTQLKRVTKNTLKGIVELKDGTKHELAVKKHSATFTTYNHKEIKGE